MPFAIALANRAKACSSNWSTAFITFKASAVFAPPAQRPLARTCSPRFSSRSAIRPLKREIRSAAEVEEKEFHEQRAPAAWLEARPAPLRTDSRKLFLEEAPWLIAIFAQPFRILPDGTKSKTYYAIESVGIATGMLLTAVHLCGLVALTHTPSPMGFLNRILGRPSHENRSCSSSSGIRRKARACRIFRAKLSRRSARLKTGAL